MLHQASAICFDNIHGDVLQSLILPDQAVNECRWNTDERT